MKVYKVLDICTDDKAEKLELSKLKGTKRPFAYHINYNNYGYAKFKIDHKSLEVFEKHLYKIEDSMSKK